MYGAFEVFDPSDTFVDLAPSKKPAIRYLDTSPF